MFFGEEKYFKEGKEERKKKIRKKEKKHLFLSFSCRSYLACNTFRQILAERLSGYFLKISKHCSGGGGEASMSLKTLLELLN